MEVNVFSKRPDTVSQELGSLNLDNLPPIPHMVVREFPTKLHDPISQHHHQNGVTMHVDADLNNYRNKSGMRYTSSRYDSRSSGTSHKGHSHNNNHHQSSRYNNRPSLTEYSNMETMKYNGHTVSSVSAKPREELSNGNALIGNDASDKLTDANFTIPNKTDHSYQQFMSQLGHVAYQKPGK